MPPEGVVDPGRGLLGVARHGLHEHLERALQQHVDAAVVVVVVAAAQRAKVSGRGSADARVRVRVCVKETLTVSRRDTGCSSTELSSACACPRPRAWPSCGTSGCSRPSIELKFAHVTEKKILTSREERHKQSQHLL